MASPSAERLKERLNEVRCLVGVCRSRRARAAKAIKSEEPALLRSALVMLCSHVEGYFEDLVEDVLLAFDGRAARSDQLPQPIRVRQTLGTTARWEVNDAKKRWLLVQECSSSPLLVDAAPHVAGGFDSGLHTGTFANPGTSQIRDLFETVGISDVWAEFAKIEPGVAYKNEIDAIVSRRNQIAHGDRTSLVTESDVQNYLLNFAHTASVFEALAAKHIASTFPGFAW